MIKGTLGEQEECEKLKRRGDEDGEKRNGDTVSKEGKSKKQQTMNQKAGATDKESTVCQVDAFFKGDRKLKRATLNQSSVAQLFYECLTAHNERKKTENDNTGKLTVIFN